MRTVAVAAVLALGSLLALSAGTARAYPPTSWVSTGVLAAPRTAQTATLLPSGKVLVVGGQGTGTSAGLASAELYDPASGMWTSAGPMAMARRHHTATLLSSGKVLVSGGTADGNNALASRNCMIRQRTHGRRPRPWL
jgi:hypothetical protein